MELTLERAKVLLYNSIVLLEEYSGGRLANNELGNGIGITTEEYEVIMGNSGANESSCGDLEMFIRQWTWKNSINISECVANDVGYDLKSDIENSEFNPVDMKNQKWDTEYDDWFDEFLEEKILPILINLGAIDENSV